MLVHVLTELAQGLWLPTSILPTVMYGELHTDSSQVPVCLQNLSGDPIVDLHQGHCWKSCSG